LITAGDEAVAPYDWAVIVTEVLRVYELAIAGAGVT
jgi:phosphatidyl-myo-inositol alpha-mannosyltransferase